MVENDSTSIQVNCEKCGRLFPLSYAEADGLKDGSEVLCPECEAQSETANERRRFEYRSYIQEETDDAMLNDYGREGWELVAVRGNRFIFKREYFG